MWSACFLFDGSLYNARCLDRRWYNTVTRLREATKTLRQGQRICHTSRRKGRPMKKNMKVIIVKTKAANGNDRTIHGIVSLKDTVADLCKFRNVPILSVLSYTVTEPMTAREAQAYVLNDFFDLITAPNTTLVKTEWGPYAA